MAKTRDTSKIGVSCQLGAALLIVLLLIGGVQAQTQNPKAEPLRPLIVQGAIETETLISALFVLTTDLYAIA